MDKETVLQTAFETDDSLYGKTIEPATVPKPQIGIDLENDLLYNLMDVSTVNQVDISKINSFTGVSRNRNELYDTLDYMSQDTTLASVLETYAEDATEMNDAGDIMWCESDDAEAGKYISYLLKSLNVNKNVFKWTSSLCKYGDVYLRLYRESEIDDKFFGSSLRKNRKNSLNESVEKSSINEDVNVAAYSKDDRYIHYLEQAPNPAQLFELTRFGKTAGYIYTNVKATPSQTDSLNTTGAFAANKYSFNTQSSDVTLYPPTEWVHGSLEDNSNRTPEEVELFTQKDDKTGEDVSVTYTVRRGESLLYDSYKTWRELMLLENSVLLNRVTQSSIVRIIGVEVGDMPKENVQPHLMNIKHMIEQKVSFDVGKNMSEYSNPGPIVNNIYIPTRNNQGVLSTQQIGGDVNVGELVDLSYYQDKLFGGLRVPKAYFGITDDSTGFNGGTSLSIISSRYAKMIKRIQNVVIQMVTDAINLILIDTHNERYINKFKLRMQSPTTQEEVDRRDNLSSKVGLVSDIMNALSDIDDVTIRLKILKSLLNDTITNTEVISLVQEKIDKLEAEEASGEDESASEDAAMEGEDMSSEGGGFDENEPLDFGDSSGDMSDWFAGEETPSDTGTETSAAPAESSETNLPSPADLNVGDMSDSTNPELQ